ncbi:MAG: GFA family protein [Cellvibrionaceae bacterium]
MTKVVKHTPYKDQCLCGLIQYEVDHIESRMGHCHCSMCRKFHGAAFATFGEAKKDHFRWTKGSEYLKTYHAPNNTKRQFCEHCGSSLIFMAANHDNTIVEFALGTLDSPIEEKPDAHIFTDNMANWYQITDNLPQFKASRHSESSSDA